VQMPGEAALETNEKSGGGPEAEDRETDRDR